MANVKNVNVETLNNREAFFLKYKKPIIYSIAALILLFGAYILFKNFYLTPRQDEASTELAKCQELFNAQQYNEALNGNKNGCVGFAKVAADYSSTDAANLANLYAGLCHANLGKWQEAVQFLDKYTPGSDAMVSPAAIAALGNAYAHVKQLDKAVDNLKKAAKMADSQAADGVNNSLSPVFLIQAAEILESQNNKAEALKIYQDIKAKYVNSPVRQEIDKYIERVSQ